jgi:biotin/methionine sulfoxide reductase
MLAAFRADPETNRLKTPSGKIEIFSERIASFGYDDCPGHAVWPEPAEWLGAKAADRHPLHMLSDQPADKLHSQLDHSPHARAIKVKGRQPITMHPDDAAARGIADGDLVRVFNDRGACLAAARLSDRIRRSVVRLSTGAWFDPADAGSNLPLEKHGNPNALTLDVGASRLSQGCIAQTCLVEIERSTGQRRRSRRTSRRYSTKLPKQWGVAQHGSCTSLVLFAGEVQAQSPPAPAARRARRRKSLPSAAIRLPRHTQPASATLRLTVLF